MAAKKKKKPAHKHKGVMGRSDVPYAKRLKMQKIGFPIVNGTVVAYVDEDDKAVMPSRARKEGWAQ